MLTDRKKFHVSLQTNNFSVKLAVGAQSANKNKSSQDNNNAKPEDCKIIDIILDIVYNKDVLNLN
jgi:hypothetical protein